MPPSHLDDACRTGAQELPGVLSYPKAQFRVYKNPGPSPTWEKSIQSIPPHPISLRSMLILTIYLMFFLMVFSLLNLLPMTYMPPYFGDTWCFPLHGSRYRCHVTRLHGVTSQNTSVFAVRTSHMSNLRFSWRWLWRMPSSGMFRRVALVRKTFRRN
jgi:hypothetical protein